jgi:hypothetical protein
VRGLHSPHHSREWLRATTRTTSRTCRR